MPGKLEKRNYIVSLEHMRRIFLGEYRLQKERWKQSKYHGPPRISFVQSDCICMGTIAAQFSALDGSASPFYDASNGRSCGTFL